MATVAIPDVESIDIEAWMNRAVDAGLNELHEWCMSQLVESAHGTARENAGKAMAFARVMQRIREMQRERST